MSISFLYDGNALPSHIFICKAKCVFGKNEKIVIKAKANANVHYNLARSYEAKGNNAKACEHYKLIASDARLGEFAKAKVATLCK